jgi:hypothetical protein
MLGEGNPGSDILSNPLLLPNGTYDIQLMFALTGEGGGTSACVGSNQITINYAAGTSTGHLYGPMSLVVNGQVVAHNYDQTLAESNMCRIPTTVDIPGVVTSRLLQWGIYTDHQNVYAPEINGYTITPYSGSAKWMIDTQGISAVKPGSTLQLYVQDWGTGHSCSNTSCSWSVSGPGSVSASGLYTAPSSQATTAIALVTVGNGTQTATVPITIPGAKYPSLVH